MPMENVSQTLNALFVLANPSDLPHFDDEALWDQVTEALQPLEKSGSLKLERLQVATLNELRNSLLQTRRDVLHLAVHRRENVAAHYGTIALCSHDGRAFNLTAQALGALLAPHPSPLVTILQSVDEDAKSGLLGFEVVAGELLERRKGTVVVAPRLRAQAQKVFLAKLYHGLIDGLSPNELAAEFAAAGDVPGLNLVRVIGASSQNPVFPNATANLSAAENASVVSGKDSSATAPAWQDVLRSKRDAGKFDVFLCHNSADKPAVQRICQRLKESGILPWLDVDELPPGQPWQPLLEQQIKNIRSAAVCFGAAGVSPWQEQEFHGFLDEFSRRKLPVIPLLLPDAPFKPEIPIFLSRMTWVDFRLSVPDPLNRLIWGITGENPEHRLAVTGLEATPLRTPGTGAG